MNETLLLPSSCPCCHQKLTVTQLRCKQCGTSISGSFDSMFHQFSEEEQVFIINFLVSNGSLKSLAGKMNKSYPTIRKMFNQIITKIE